MIRFDAEDYELPRPRWKSALAYASGFLTLLVLTMLFIAALAIVVLVLVWFGFVVYQLPRG